MAIQAAVQATLFLCCDCMTQRPCGTRDIIVDMGGIWTLQQALVGKHHVDLQVLEQVLGLVFCVTLTSMMRENH